LRRYGAPVSGFDRLFEVVEQLLKFEPTDN
jgi:hypothetical protein